MGESGTKTRASFIEGSRGVQRRVLTLSNRATADTRATIDFAMHRSIPYFQLVKGHVYYE
jgi:hypothetical protein